MSRRVALSVAIMGVVFGLTLAADERPTPEFQNVMKSNAAVIGAMGLPAHIKDKNYEALGKDAATLRENFTKIEAFWAQRKADDAVAVAKTGVKGASELETAAKAKDDAGIARARHDLTATCQACHQRYRLMIVTENRFEIIDRSPARR